MSWQDYVQKQLIDTELVSEACILSLDDGSLWASSPPSFSPKAYIAPVAAEDGTEKEVLVNEMSDLVSAAKTLQKPANGLRINSIKYTITRAFPNGTAEDGLKTLTFKRHGGGGTLCVTNQCIIIGCFSEDKSQSAQNCNLAVENLARYLKTSNF